ncbi:hypothetical protein [Paenibacillus sp. MBLB4367]|uniref:hypothetical protein n=1 Tax=Paenibacillus sp. MBLB4367 TaxID=3384767 RepID=UPI003907F7DF
MRKEMRQSFVYSYEGKRGWLSVGEEWEKNRRMADIERAALERAEITCYRVAYYLLNIEDAAVRAARCALLELYRDDRFFDKPESAQTKLAKAAAIKASLSEKQQLLLRKQARAGASEAAAGDSDAARFPLRQTAR